MWTADEIQKLRQYLNLTQAELADMISASRHSVMRWEGGESRPNGKAIVELNRLWESIPLTDRAQIKQIWYYPTNDWGDYKWVKVAHKNGDWSKWKCFPVDKVGDYHENNNHTLVFQTISHYVEQNTGSEQISNLCFDWDVSGENWRKNFERCRNSVLLAFEFFFDLGLDEPANRVFFSGGRSYQMEIPHQPFGIQPQVELNRVMKSLALHINEYILDELDWMGLEIDDSLYSNPKMFRLSNSRYPKGKSYPPYDTYKIELSHKEVEEIKSIDDLWELAKKPRSPLYDVDVFKTYEPIPDAVEWYQELKAEYDEHEAETTHIPVYDEAIKMMDGLPSCIADLRKHGINEEGTLNQATLCDACYCKDAGISQSEAIGIINTWAQKVSQNLTSKRQGKERERHTKSVVKSVYSSKDKKYKFSCGNPKSLGLKCDSHNCPLHNRYDLRKHSKNIRIVENLQFDEDDTHIVDSIDEARNVMEETITNGILNNSNLMLTMPPGIGKTTKGVQTLEQMLRRFIYAGPRHDNCDMVVETIAQKDNWTRILPRRPHTPKPKDKNLVNQWKATALCPLFNYADKLAALRYNVGKILCAEGKEGTNPNWCGIEKGVCKWWQQFITDKSATVVHEYLSIPTLMDLLMGEYEKPKPNSAVYSDAPVIIFDEPSPDTFIEKVIISTKTMTETISQSDSKSVRKLLTLLRKVVENTTSTEDPNAIYGMAVMQAIIDAYDGAFEDLLSEVADTIKNPNFITIEAEAVHDATDKAYHVSVNGKLVWIPKEWEVSMKPDCILFRMPPNIAEEKEIMPQPKNNNHIVHKEKHKLILQFVDDLVKLLSIEYKRFQSGELYNSAFTIQNTVEGPSLVMRLRKNLQIPSDLPLLILDANGDAELLSHLTVRKIEEYKVSVKMNATIIQILDGRYGITTLYDKKEKKPRPSFNRLLRIVRNIAKIHDPNDIFICTWKDLEPHLLAKQEDGELPNEIVIDHYGNIRGSNEFENRSVGIMFGTPCPPPEDTHMDAQCFWYSEDYVSDEMEEQWIQYRYKDQNGNSWEIKMKRYKDPRMEMLRRRYVEMEIYHAAHRIRLLLKVGKIIYLLENLPIDELPPTEMLTVDELTYQTDPEFQEFERQVAEFEETHGGIWLKQARKFTDVTLWKLTRWFEFACRRNGYEKNDIVVIDANTRLTVFYHDEIDPERIRGAYRRSKIEQLLKEGQVKELREWLGMRQQEFADRLGYQKSSISMIESGDRNLTEQIKMKICELFGKIPISESMMNTGVNDAMWHFSRISGLLLI